MGVSCNSLIVLELAVAIYCLYRASSTQNVGGDISYLKVSL